MRRRPSPSLVISCLALFVALSGSAVALQGKNTIASDDIKPGAVKRGDIARNAIIGAKVARNSLGGAEIRESSLGPVPGPPTGPAGGALDGNFPRPSLASNSVRAVNLTPGAVRAGHLATIVEFASTAPVTSGANVTAGVDCPPGMIVVSGGAQPAHFGVELTTTMRNGNGWLAQATNNTAITSSLTVKAYCLAG